MSSDVAHAPTVPAVVTIASLDQEGRGIARVEGKAVFVEGALPQEAVTITMLKRKPTYDIARAERIVKANAARVIPRCPHFGVCGGCTLQHFDAGAQLAAKQRTLEDTLWHLGRVRAAQILPAIHGPAWSYRHRARLSVRHVPKKGGVLVGFHERKSSFVADMTSCCVLPPKISALLPELRALIGALTVRDRLPQIELAVGDDTTADDSVSNLPLEGTFAATAYVLVLRILAPLAQSDEDRLRAFADLHGVQFYLQPDGPETAVPFHPAGERLAYTLPEFGLVFPYSPTEFTQVNPAINRVLVRRAMALLDPRPGERIVDFFCGIGNFTLPIARRGALAMGVEGSAALVRRAQDNALRNGLGERASFRIANLFAVTAETVEAMGTMDRALLDPPREGAIAVVKALPPDGGPQRIVYVSCNPATLARDAAVLVQERGYTLSAAGVVNMFPHTAHVESIAVFER
jgi:23S rRNA (uracil1939-C5)-methyltransferase